MDILIQSLGIERGRTKVINAIKAIAKDCPVFKSMLDTKQDVTKEMEKEEKYLILKKAAIEEKKAGKK